MTHIDHYVGPYLIFHFLGSAGDVLMDLRANFACTYTSPFVRGHTEPQLDSGLNPSSTTSTISSRGSAGSGYHTDDEHLYLSSSVSSIKCHPSKPLFSSHGHSQTRFHCELENRLNSLSDQPMKLTELNTTRGGKPAPPPRSGLKTLRTTNSHIPRKLSRNGSNGSLLMHRPILAKSTTLTSV